MLFLLAATGNVFAQGEGSGGEGDADGGAGPTAMLHAIDLQGMAPFAVHVHGLNSTPGTGDPLSTRYQWDFGDPDGDYNILEGWNAAHLYDSPGSYVVTLTITSETGASSIATANVTVSADTRSQLYVAANGNDSNDGSSPSKPLRTFSKAFQLLDDDTTVHFRRGDTFNVGASASIVHHNCVIKSYGSGGRPKLRWTGGTGVSTMIDMFAPGAYDIVIQDLAFDSQYASFPDRDIADAIKPAGENITVRRSAFSHLTTALNTNRIPTGVLSYDNTATNLRAYYVWGQGSDHTHLGCTVSESWFEHNIRFGGITRALVSDCDLTNSGKRHVWAMLGTYVYVRGNRMNVGRSTVGPNHVVGSPNDRFKWCVFENNLFNTTESITPALEVEHGAEHVMIRNNIIQTIGNSTIAVKGYDSTMNRTSVDVRIFNNTGIMSSPNGRFLNAGTDINSIAVANNLYVAPNLITGEYRRAIMYVEDNDLSSFPFIRHNVWPIPSEFLWVGDGYHYVWPSWAHPEGYKNIQEWDAYPQTNDEYYESVTLDSKFALPPDSVPATHAQPVPGVFTDFYGAARPLNGDWAAGAVGEGESDPEPQEGDLDGDGDVDLNDLCLWHQNPVDLNRDGEEDQADAAIIAGLIGDPYEDCNDNAIPDSCEGLIEVAQLVPDDSPPGEMDGPIAVNGDVVVFGAPNDDTLGIDAGAAYVFERDGGEWVQRAKLLASNGNTGDAFGRSVAIEGATIVIGAPYRDLEGVDLNNDAGAVYIYERAGDAWYEQQMLTATDATAFDHLGSDVAMHGNYLIAGAPDKDVQGADSGAAYVFRRTGGSWQQEMRIAPADGQSGDGFGGAIALHGNGAVIGAAGDDDWANECGAAYIYRRYGTTYVSEAKLWSAAPGAGDRFGDAVAMHANRVLIGAPRNDQNGVDSGAAEMFMRSALIWIPEQKLDTFGAAAGDGFGRSVALQGDLALVGAWKSDVQGPDAGAASVFRLIDDVWAQQGNLETNSIIAGELLGTSVALDSDLLVASAPGGSALDSRVHRLVGEFDINQNGIPDTCEPPTCLADLDGDGLITINDALIVLSSWGPCVPGDPCPADLDGDGTIGFSDFSIVLASMGPCQ